MCILTHHTQTSIILSLITRIYIKLYIGLPCGSASEESTLRRETRIPFLCQEDPLEKEMATHSNTLA